MKDPPGVLFTEKHNIFAIAGHRPEPCHGTGLAESQSRRAAERSPFCRCVDSGLLLDWLSSPCCGHRLACHRAPLRRSGSATHRRHHGLHGMHDSNWLRASPRITAAVGRKAVGPLVWGPALGYRHRLVYHALAWVQVRNGRVDRQAAYPAWVSSAQHPRSHHAAAVAIGIARIDPCPCPHAPPPPHAWPVPLHVLLPPAKAPPLHTQKGRKAACPPAPVFLMIAYYLGFMRLYAQMCAGLCILLFVGHALAFEHAAHAVRVYLVERCICGALAPPDAHAGACRHCLPCLGGTEPPPEHVCIGRAHKG